MDESTIDRVDEPAVTLPWPEARGPHLPDAAAKIPPLAWLFIVLAACRLAWAVGRADLGPAPDVATVVPHVLGTIPSVTAMLFPAALLARRPDAGRRTPMLLIGTVLLAIPEALRVLADPLGPVVVGATPAIVTGRLLVSLVIAHRALVSLVGTIGIAGMALGLAQVRRYDDARAARTIVLAFGTVVILISAARVVDVTQLPLGQASMTPAPSSTSARRRSAGF